MLVNGQLEGGITLDALNVAASNENNGLSELGFQNLRNSLGQSEKCVPLIYFYGDRTIHIENSNLASFCGLTHFCTSSRRKARLTFIGLNSTALFKI